MNNEEFINELNSVASFLPEGTQVRAVVEKAVARMLEQQDRLIACAKQLERIESQRFCIPDSAFGGGDPGILAKSIRDLLKGEVKPNAT